MRLKDQAEKVTDCFHLKFDLINIPEDNCLRLAYTKEEDDELVASIIKNGQLTPIVIHKENDKIWVVFGSRRMRALGIIRSQGIPIGVDGRDTVKCIYEDKIRDESGKMRDPTPVDRIFSQLGENDHVRHSQLEYGTAFKTLIASGVTLKEICEKTHRSRTWVNDCLNLADAPEVIQKLVKDGKIKETTAKKIRQAHPKDRETAVLSAELGNPIKGKDLDKAKRERLEKNALFSAENFLSGLKLYGFKTYDEVGKEIAYSHKITIEQKSPAFIAVAVLPI